MTNMFLNSDFEALSNEGLCVQIFQVVSELVRGQQNPSPLGTYVTNIGQPTEGSVQRGLM